MLQVFDQLYALTIQFLIHTCLFISVILESIPLFPYAALPEFSCDLECENGECGVVNTSPRVEQCFCDVGYELNGANCIGMVVC